MGGQRLKDHRAGRIDHQMQQGDVHRQQQQRQQADGRDRQMDRQGVTEGLVQVGLDASAQGDRLHQAAEVVVQQHQIGRLPRHGRPPLAHRHTDVGGLEGGGIVDAVAGHRHHLTGRLQGLHDLQLLLRQHPRKHRHAAQVGPAGGMRGLQLRTGEHRSRRQTRLLGDGTGRLRSVARDHHHPDASPAGQGDGGEHVVAQGIGQADQADRFEQVVVHCLRGGLAR